MKKRDTLLYTFMFTIALATQPVHARIGEAPTPQLPESSVQKKLRTPRAKTLTQDIFDARMQEFAAQQKQTAQKLLRQQRINNRLYLFSFAVGAGALIFDQYGKNEQMKHAVDNTTQAFKAVCHLAKKGFNNANQFYTEVAKNTQLLGTKSEAVAPQKNDATDANGLPDKDIEPELDLEKE